jgi:hypothetical protein
MVMSPRPEAAAGHQAVKSLAWPFLLLACALLAWDLLAVGRQHRTAYRAAA